MSARGVGRSKQSRAIVERLFHAAARLGKVADLRHAPAETLVVGDELKYVGKSSVTFTGWMLDGTGRFVAEEVVTTAAATPDAFYMSALPGHKAGFLNRCLDAGGVSVLTVVDGAGKVFAFDWAVVRASLARPFGAVGKIALGSYTPTEPGGYLTTFVRKPPPVSAPSLPPCEAAP